MKTRCKCFHIWYSIGARREGHEIFSISKSWWICSWFKNIINDASGLPDGKTADEFAEIFKESIKDIHEDDEIVLLADIVGGSPLTTALNVLAEKGLMEKTTTIGGMNLPLALTSVLMKDTLQGDSFVQAVLSEATTALQEFKVVEDDEDDI